MPYYYYKNNSKLTYRLPERVMGTLRYPPQVLPKGPWTLLWEPLITSRKMMGQFERKTGMLEKFFGRRRCLVDWENWLESTHASHNCCCKRWWILAMKTLINHALIICIRSDFSWILLLFLLVFGCTKWQNIDLCYSRVQSELFLVRQTKACFLQKKIPDWLINF